MKINLQKSVGTCGYELPTNLQNFTQKDLAEVKIFPNVLEGLLFLKHPVVGKKHCLSWLFSRRQSYTSLTILSPEALIVPYQIR